MVSASSTVVLWLIAIGLGIALWRKKGGISDDVKRSFESFLAIMPRIAVALLLAGFVAKLVPSDTVAGLIGPNSGWQGILIGSVTGGFVPAGPIIAFPLVVVLYKAGAGVPQLIAFLTAWSVFAFHRVMIYESTLMGWRFSAVRLASSLILPPLAGVLAALLALAIPVR
jgi:uncharacterized membrane protein YraQ (UPF0718 family)